jgi:UrcA family protein
MLPSTRVTVLVGDQYVDYSDLLVVTNVGGDRLLRRIRLAANAFCSPTQDAAQLTCRIETMTRAVASLQSSAVTARHQWETPAALTAA